MGALVIVVVAFGPELRSFTSPTALSTRKVGGVAPKPIRITEPAP
jgi:hypothetical protein